MNKGLISRLLETLKKEYEYYNSLNKMAAEKKECIIKNDIQKLSKLIQEDDKVIVELKELENERIDIIKELAVLYNISNDNINFTSLMEYLPELNRDELSLIRDKLLDIITELHEHNQENKVLIEEAVKINDFSMRLIMNTLEIDQKTYNNGQNKSDNKVNHFIDRKA
jgi:flagellar biosynthesis/type III secretory pathway chaperone